MKHSSAIVAVRNNGSPIRLYKQELHKVTSIIPYECWTAPHTWRWHARHSQCLAWLGPFRQCYRSSFLERKKKQFCWKINTGLPVILCIGAPVPFVIINIIVIKQYDAISIFFKYFDMLINQQNCRYSFSSIFRSLLLKDAVFCRQRQVSLGIFVALKIQDNFSAVVTSNRFIRA